LKINVNDILIITENHNDIISAYHDPEIHRNKYIEEKLVDIENVEYLKQIKNKSDDNFDISEFNDIIYEERNGRAFSHDLILRYGEWASKEIERIRNFYGVRFVGKNECLTKIAGIIWKNLRNSFVIDKELDSSRYSKKRKIEDTFRIKMCPNNNCESKICSYAHRQSELRCFYHFNGRKCKFGYNCRHSHNEISKNS